MSKGHVGHTIVRQINEIDRWALMSYGAKDFVTNELSETRRPGITFSVMGAKCKRAKVEITLNASDLYDIRVFKISPTTFDIKDYANVGDVFCGDLVAVLDSLVEGKE